MPGIFERWQPPRQPAWRGTIQRRWDAIGQRRVRSLLVVQVDNATPIVLRFEKFVIGGIHGSAGPSRSTRH
jgi:hypothetical protein